MVPDGIFWLSVVARLILSNTANGGSEDQTISELMVLLLRQ